jgi:uncharacterized protein RhaS with RHS repeats
MKTQIKNLLVAILFLLILKPAVVSAYYDPELGRFIQPDTVIPDLSNPQSYNRYSYVLNNPLRYTDPSGHQTTPAEAEPEREFEGEINREIRESQNINSRGEHIVTTEQRAQDIRELANSAAAMRMRGLDPNKTYIGPLETQTVGASAKAPKADEAASSAIVKFDAKFALQQGANPATVVPGPYAVVRGGQAPMPAAGTTFSGSMGATVPEAAAGVPHGTIRSTTAGAVREQGGSVVLAPEATRSGAINQSHVNVTEASSPTVFGPPAPNPVPKSERVQ